MSITALFPAVVVSVSAIGLANCGAPKTDYSKNEGAVAWLAHHHGAIPRACISQLVEKRGTSVDIDEDARRQVQADAMQIAGQTYAVSLASEHLIRAREKELELAREGYARGYMVEAGVTDAITKLNEAISGRERSRFELGGLDTCDFTVTDAAFGFKYRLEVSYYSIGN